MSKGRASKGKLVPPSVTANVHQETRNKWLEKAHGDFVTRTPANKRYYSAILEILWPVGHGIPGPHVSENAIRSMINSLRKAEGHPPYADPFRRMRELQGDEGFHCIIKEGVNYQLVSLAIEAKREPRASLAKKVWDGLREANGFSCAHCGGSEPAVKLSPDHRVPRSRGGSNELDNWQPLCEQCNNIKSSICQGCALNCFTCNWAYPEKYKAIVINDDNKEQIRRYAELKGDNQSSVANQILAGYFVKKMK